MRRLFSTPSLAGYLNVAELLKVVIYTGAYALVVFLSTFSADITALIPNPTMAGIVGAAIVSLLTAAKAFRDGHNPVPPPAAP